VKTPFELEYCPPTTRIFLCYDRLASIPLRTHLSYINPVSHSIPDHPKPAKKSLVSIARVVAVATLVSKVAGLARQQVMAAAFGLGTVATAYSYSYVVPSFFFILLGGINGPFHSAVTSVLSRQKDREKIGPIIEAVTTIVGLILIVASVLLIIFAGQFIDLFANGLKKGLDIQQSSAVRNIAVEQLQIMAFMTLLSGLIGIGFGTLNAGDMYWLPSISPLLSSFTVIGGLGWFLWQFGGKAGLLENARLGGQVLAWSTLAGALLQWLVQVVVQWRSGLGTLRWRLNWRNKEVREILGIMLPAVLSTSMLQINLFTDLTFAASIPRAAPAFAAANLLVQVPLGIVSSFILTPMMPVFSRLVEPRNWPELKDRIRQGLILIGLTMMPLGATFIALALPLVQVAFERGNFTFQDSQFLASILVVSASGMFFFLGRDLLIRVFYALGDGKTPFKISIINIFINLGLDFLLYKPFGAPGITLSTIGVNVITFVIFLVILNKRLNGLPWADLGFPLFGIFGATSISGCTSWAIGQVWRNNLPQNFISLVLELVVAGGIGLLLFGLISTQIGIPEVDILIGRIRQKFKKK
jgi:putative peptidoglycan lipid II flippase